MIKFFKNFQMWDILELINISDKKNKEAMRLQPTGVKSTHYPSSWNGNLARIKNSDYLIKTGI